MPTLRGQTTGSGAAGVLAERSTFNGVLALPITDGHAQRGAARRGGGSGGSAAGTAGWLARPLAIMALVGALAPTTAVGQGTGRAWEVQVSAVEEALGGEFEAMAYFPGSLVIHAGDTVRWRFEAVHTVTFPAGRPAPPRTVPGPGLGEATLGPVHFPAGGAVYDGSEPVNSGRPLFVPPEAFAYELTFPLPGVHGYVCLLHPGMRGEVTVLPAGAPLPETPEQARARGEATVAPLLALARADAAAARLEATSGVHAALAGVANGNGASAKLFLPGDLTVKRGDTVVWTRADAFDSHTVTFPGPGNAPPAFVEVRPQPSGEFLFVQPAASRSRSPGNNYAGEGLANSGILMSPGGTYLLRFDAPPGTYEYLCLLHPEMKGSVTVTG
ncbi:MAG: hypothetical protein AVDCRST_MAG77-3369 [uncultured Chloroflexi bacterium]|uniref:Blue (type 1) copper domain-containing protein n=1 Tax=uncultured Chloroflexota bacterium TaxID=166587 RepID=A0A6J4JAF9_9CHLR|nr:MAG: hypothetical protein AVDCRST_MAG77-3369 [uncultured Chloroflexota bacterium]